MLRVDDEIIEEQVTVNNAHGIVVEAQRHSVRDADKSRLGQQQLAIHLRTRQAALYGQLTIAVALQSDDLVGHEAIDQ